MTASSSPARNVHSDATRRDDRRNDSTDETIEATRSQSRCAVSLNRDTIVPDFVILVNPLNSCACASSPGPSTSTPGEATTSLSSVAASVQELDMV